MTGKFSDKLVVFVTCATAAEAGAIARSVVEKRLAACASLGAPMQSIFTWKGERQESTEYPLTIKTRKEQFPALAAEIRRLHTYETPEIVAVPLAGGNPSYLKWIDESLGIRK